MQQAHLFISGTVQGVGFRYFVRNNARRLGLTGFARNTPARQSPHGFRRVAGGEDGGVEVVLQSSASSDQEGKSKIEEMIGLCRKGPFLSVVKQIGFEWEEVEEKFEEFKVL